MIFVKNYFVNTTQEIDFISIIHEVRYTIRDSNVKDGLLTIITPGAGAGVLILEPIKEVIDSIKVVFETLGGETDAEAVDKRKERVYVMPRVLASIIGRDISIPIRKGELLLEPYEEVFLIDFDKKVRRREFYMQVMSIPEPPPPTRPARRG